MPRPWQRRNIYFYKITTMKKKLALIKNKTFLKKAGIILAGLLLIGALFFFLKTTDRIFIDDSLISAPVITVSATTNGKLKELPITEGQLIKKGDELAVVGNETIRSD